MVQKVLLQIEIDDANLDAAQAKADKLVATLKEAEGLIASVNKKLAVAEWTSIQATNLAKEKPPEGGKTCERTPPDPVLLRKAQERVDARKRGAGDSVDVLCATLDKVIRCVAQDIFKPPD